MIEDTEEEGLIREVAVLTQEGDIEEVVIGIEKEIEEEEEEIIMKGHIDTEEIQEKGDEEAGVLIIEDSRIKKLDEGVF
jgi:hypothetical protein